MNNGTIDVLMIELSTIRSNMVHSINDTKFMCMPIIDVIFSSALFGGLIWICLVPYIHE